MTFTSWPYVNQDATDVQYSRLFREMAYSGVVDTLGGTVLKVYADSSGMSVKCPAGSAIVRGYMGQNDAEMTLTIAASESQSRVDRVVLELNLAQPLVADRIIPKVLKGTAGSATPPVLTQTDSGIYQISLALVTVDASVVSIAAGKVSDDRDFISGRIGRWSSSSKRPSSPRKYELGYNEGLSIWEYYDGSGWQNLVVPPAWANITGKPSSFPTTPGDFTGTLPVSKGGTGQTDLSAVTVGNSSLVDGNAFKVQPTAPTSPAANTVWLW